LKTRRFILVAVWGLMLLLSSPAFADTITFYLNTDETPGKPPANTIEVQVTLTSSGPNNNVTITFTNLDPSNSSYDFHNVFFNVNGSSEIGSCTQSSFCSSITGTGSGNGPYYYVSNQSGGYGAMTYNVDDTGTAATSVTIDLTATDGNSWASARNVLTPDGSGYEASVELLTQSGYQAAGSYAAPEPPGMFLLAAGLLAVGLVVAFRDKLPRTARVDLRRDCVCNRCRQRMRT
jgi:hypothetical protein